MSRLDSAFDRFNKALDRVEGRLRESARKHGAGQKALALNGAGQNGAGADARLEALQADRDQLALQLEEARSDYATLQSLTDEVETRLDVAIENIHKVMRG
jgi:hypothetical protein